MVIFKSPLLDGLSSIPELTEFLKTVPNFRTYVVDRRYSVADVIKHLYEASHCHHKFPDNLDELETDDYQFQDFLHTVLTVAKTMHSRIETVFGENY